MNIEDIREEVIEEFIELGIPMRSSKENSEWINGRMYELASAYLSLNEQDDSVSLFVQMHG